MTRTTRAVSALRRSPGDALLLLFAVLAFGYLFVPIGYVVAFSFNDGGRSNLIWRGFTLDNWANPCGCPRGLRGPAEQRPDRPHRHRPGDADGDAARLCAGPLPVPGPRGDQRPHLPADGHARGGPRGLAARAVPQRRRRARVLDHRPRAHHVHHQLRGGDGEGPRRHPRPTAGGGRGRPLLLRACRPSGASRCPCCCPGIAAAALLSFSLSFDDFIITNFNSGNTDTFPKFVYVAAARGIPAQAYVIGSAMFALSLLVVLAGRILSVRRATAA
jgi:spermidine/putrescine transport system permease protein